MLNHGDRAMEAKMNGYAERAATAPNVLSPDNREEPILVALIPSTRRQYPLFSSPA